ncbi:MAG: DNA translocase FtsK 4TM domain-containing protein, partial [Burkholderiales bacterium]
MAAAQKSQAGTALPARLAGLIREAKWLALVAAAGYLLLILMTHHATDPGFSRSATAAVVQNAGGRVGAMLSDVMLMLFGWSAFWWAILCLLTVVRGYRRIENHEKIESRSLILSIAGFALLLVASAALEYLRLHSYGQGLPQEAGGIVGIELGKILGNFLGLTGATLLTLAAIAVGWSLFSGLSWLRIAEFTGFLLETAWGYAQRTWETRRDEKIGEQAREKRDSVVQAERKREEDHPPVVIAPPPVEIRKSERVQKEKQARLFEHLPDTPLPPLKLLDEPEKETETVSAETLEFTSRLIEKKLSDFGVAVKVLAAYPGPVITRYEIEPAVGVKGSQIVNLIKDLARALSVMAIRVVETIPGKSCMGLEIPNPHRQTVRLTEILSSETYHGMHSPLALALGKDIAGLPVVADLAKMPHLLVAGTTGSGKSVAINAMILSLLYKAEPKHVLRGRLGPHGDILVADQLDQV